MSWHRAWESQRGTSERGGERDQGISQGAEITETKGKAQGQHCEALEGLGSSTMPLLVASETCGTSGDVEDKAYDVKGIFKELQSFPNPFYPECQFCGFHGNVSSRRASRDPCVLGGKAAPARAVSLSCTYYKSKQVHRYRLDRKIFQEAR